MKNFHRHLRMTVQTTLCCCADSYEAVLTNVLCARMIAAGLARPGVRYHHEEVIQEQPCPAQVETVDSHHFPPRQSTSGGRADAAAQAIAAERSGAAGSCIAACGLECVHEHLLPPNSAPPSQSNHAIRSFPYFITATPCRAAIIGTGQNIILPKGT